MNDTQNATEATTADGNRNAEYMTATIAVKIVGGLLLLILIYITVSLTIYGRREHKFKRTSHMDFTGGYVFILMLAASAACCVRVFWSWAGKMQ